MGAILALLRRSLRHLFGGWLLLPRAFPRRVLDRIQDAIAEGERAHCGEICFAVESRLAPLDIWRGISPRRRALHLFAGLGVWETERQNGVLIYVLLAEHAIEVHPDRGIAGRVPAARWQAVCDDLGAAFARGEYEAGAVAAVHAVGALLAEHYPARPGMRNPNELPDGPVLV